MCIRDRLGIAAKHFKAWGKAVRGARRALRIPIEELQIRALEPDNAAAGYRVEFALPAGAYATVVLNELMTPAH